MSCTKRERKGLNHVLLQIEQVPFILGLFDSKTGFLAASAKFQLKIMDNDPLKLTLSPITTKMLAISPMAIFLSSRIIPTIVGKNHALHYREIFVKNFHKRRRTLMLKRNVSPQEIKNLNHSLHF